MKPKKRGSAWLVRVAVSVVAAIVAVPVLYVLSIGPVFWVQWYLLGVDIESIDKRLEWFYAPLFLACKAYPELAAFINWYLHPW